jgi:ribosomal-protein-alanine N-acetyltransferase
MNLELYTERLRLTPLSDADFDISLEMFKDPKLVEHFCDLMTEEEIRGEMPNWTKRGADGCIGIWCSSDRMTGEKYGSVMLLPMAIEEDDTNYDLLVPGEMPPGHIEVGYALKCSAWGKGFATEACKRLVQFAFEATQLNELLATLEEENTASVSVLVKAGFVSNGRMFCYGEDSPCYRLTRSEWVEQQAAG